MTPALRTTILDALMERWREDVTPDWVKSDDVATSKREQFDGWLELEEPAQRARYSFLLEMILPVAEPMIREAALREAADVASDYARSDNEDSA